MIVKLQRPLTDPFGIIYAYDRTRRKKAFVDMPAKDITRWFGNEYKIYVEATWSGSSPIIHQRVPDQTW